MRNTELSLLGKSFIAGAVATLALTLLMYLSPLAGFPAIDMPSAIGGFLDRPAGLFTPAWWIGLAIFVFVGVVVSPVLFYHFVPNLYGRAWLRGIEWGIILWVFGGVGAMFYLGLAFHEPFTTHPQMGTLASLIGNVLYGAVLGAIAGTHTASVIQPSPSLRVENLRRV